MLERIVLPATHLLPSCVECSVVTDQREIPEGTFGRGEIRYGFRVQIAAARLGVYPLRATRKTEGGYVTITLREAAYWPSRNSRTEEWLKVAGHLRARGERVVVVRDTQRADEPFGDHEISPIVSCDILARAALYAAAEMNLFTNNGPAWLCMFLGAPCTIFKMTAPGAPCVSDEFFAGYGFPRGSSWPNARPGQRVVWSDDLYDDIISAIGDHRGRRMGRTSSAELC